VTYVISTDSGGTFVDGVILDDQGRAFIGKAPTTPGQPSIGILGAVEAAAEMAGIAPAEVLANCRMFFNGTTVTTNAMIQRRGAKSGLIITEGFQDTLIIGRVKSRWIGLDEGELLNFNRVQRPAPVVPLELTRGVNERIDCFGKVIKSIALSEVERLIDELVLLGIESLAVCLLWSFKNPSHELAVADLARRKYPHLYVVASSDLVPAIGEYERANTTAVEAFLGPTLRAYLSDIDRSLTNAGYKGEMLVMQSIGGLAPASGLTHAAVTTLHSGPVGGIVAACKLGELIGEKNLITADMGGTTFDVGLVVDGKPQTAQMTVMERNLLMVPAVEAISIGAGGGSVAWLDVAQALHVGPQSQGAHPGPACYGRGGELPTVTDADVVLGYINPATFLGGHMSLDADLARKAIKTHVADPLGMSVEASAQAIYEIVNAHMADLVRRVSIERGHDPRDFAMVAFGGCGPTHATGYGVESQVRRVIVPPTATVFSAFGIAQSEIRHFFTRTCVRVISGELRLADDLLRELNAHFAELKSRAEQQFQRDGVDPDKRLYRRIADLRYLTQVHEVTVPFRMDEPVTAESLRLLVSDFKDAYERLYGAGSNPSEGAIEIVTLRLDASAKTPSEFRPRRHQHGGAAADQAFLRHRQVWWKEFGGYHSTPTFLLEEMRPGNVIEGPAVVESYGTTIPLHGGQRAELDEWLNLIVTFPGVLGSDGDQVAASSGGALR
jgi:N-methylhydantoinase A